MFQTTHDMISAISFIVSKGFSDRRHAGDVYNIGDQFLIISGPQAGIAAEAVRIKNLNGTKYLYARDLKDGKDLRLPICFAKETRPL